jgi:hypothetical protein
MVLDVTASLHSARFHDFYLAQTEAETLGRIRIQRFYSNCKNKMILNLKKKFPSSFQPAANNFSAD